MLYKKVYFVSGIDTDAGKSYATGILAAAWKQEGCKVITQKFIQTGCGEDCGSVSEDIVIHRKIMGTGLLPEDINHTTCPIRFSYPASPHLASRIDKKDIELGEIEKSTNLLLEKYDIVLIEGAGGLMVPVKGNYLTIDYITERSLPLILVTNPKLGSVNHTLLSLELCRKRGVEVDYLIYNHYPETSQVITDDTRTVFQSYIADNFPECEFIEIPFLDLDKHKI